MTSAEKRGSGRRRGEGWACGGGGGWEKEWPVVCHATLTTIAAAN